MATATLDENGYPLQAVGIPVTGSTQIVAISTSSATSNPLVAGAYRIVVTINAFLASGASATTSDLPVLANREEYFNVVEDETISVIAASGTGSLFLTRMD